MAFEIQFDCKIFFNKNNALHKKEKNIYFAILVTLHLF